MVGPAVGRPGLGDQRERGGDPRLRRAGAAMAQRRPQQRQQAHRALDAPARLGEIPAQVPRHRIGHGAGEGQAAVHHIGQALLERPALRARQGAHVLTHPGDHRPHVIGDQVPQGAGGVGEGRVGLGERTGPAHISQQAGQLRPHRAAVAQVDLREPGIGGGDLGDRLEQHRLGAAGGGAGLGLEIVDGVHHGAQQPGGRVDPLEVAAEPEQVRADGPGHRRVRGEHAARGGGRAPLGALLLLGLVGGDRGGLRDAHPHVLDGGGAVIGGGGDPAGQHLVAVLGAHHQQLDPHRTLHELLAAVRVQARPGAQLGARGGGPQLEILVQQLAAQIRQRGAQVRVLQQARAQRVEDLDVPAARGLDQPGHAAQRRRPEIQRIQQRGGDQAQHRIHRVPRIGVQPGQAQGEGAGAGAQIAHGHHRGAQQVRHPAVVEALQRILGVAGQHHGATRPSLGAQTLVEGGADGVEEGMQTPQRRGAVERGRAAGEDPAQLERGAGPVGHVHRVLEHRPRPVGGAGHRGGQGEQVPAAARGDADGGPQIGGILEQLRDRGDIGGQHRAGPVEVRVQRIQQPHPLDQPGGELGPVLGVQHQRDGVDLGHGGGDVAGEHHRRRRRRAPSAHGAESVELVDQGLRG